MPIAPQRPLLNHFPPFTSTTIHFVYPKVIHNLGGAGSERKKHYIQRTEEPVTQEGPVCGGGRQCFIQNRRYE